jgi:hypothetical protein
MASELQSMAPFTINVGLAGDVDHVAAYKAMISGRSERGRQLLHYFDQIVAIFQAKQDYLISYIHLLKQSHLDHVSNHCIERRVIPGYLKLTSNRVYPSLLLIAVYLHVNARLQHKASSGQETALLANLQAIEYLRQSKFTMSATTYLRRHQRSFDNLPGRSSTATATRPLGAEQ